MFDTLIAGVVHGNAYALLAVGITLIFGVTNVINFAHGAVFALGSILGWWLIAEQGFPLWLTIVLVVAATAIVGIAIDLLAVHPLRKAPAIAAPEEWPTSSTSSTSPASAPASRSVNRASRASSAGG